MEKVLVRKKKKILLQDLILHFQYTRLCDMIIFLFKLESICRVYK